MKRVLFCLLVLASLPADAEWVKVTFAANGAGDIYLDPTTITKTGDARQVWELLDRPTPDQGLVSVVTLVEFDCKEKKLRHIQTTAYSGHMAKGEILGLATAPDAWQDIAPGTVDEVSLNYACTH